MDPDRQDTVQCALLYVVHARAAELGGGLSSHITNMKKMYSALTETGEDDQAAEKNAQNVFIYSLTYS